MTILLDFYNLIYILLGVSVIFGIIARHIKIQLKNSWIQDIDLTLKSHCNEQKCKERINDNVSSKFDLVARDLASLKESMAKIENIMSNQQETLLAIQLGLTELKPRIDSLEKRVEKIEYKMDK